MRFNWNKLQEDRQFTNNQWGTSYRLEPEQELLKMALTSFLDKSFYETMNDKLERLRELCTKVDIDFLIKLSTWAREKGLRTVNQVMLIEALKHDDFINYFQKLVQRPDEIIDILGYYVMINKQHPKKIKLANKLKKAIKQKLESFDDYKLSKYKGKWDVINLYDIVNMTHSFSESIDKMMKGKLQPAETWEVELSKNWNTKESWNKLIKENKLWALAFIRNLRNILQSWVKENELATYINTINTDKVFPFQVIQAFEIAVTECGIKENSELYKTLERIVYKSFESFKQYFPWKVAFGLDVSWSMDSTINTNSKLTRTVLGGYYALALQQVLDADLYFWGTSCTQDNEATMQQIRRINWGGTDINCLIQAVQGEWYDHIIVITDEQLGYDYNGKWDLKNLVIWNIADYNGSLIPSFETWYTYMTGFNDAMFEIVSDLNNISELVKNIKSLA